MDRLKGKVALISGGARGQGAAEARQFVSEGAKVVIGDVLDNDCRKAADSINAKFAGKPAIPIHLDVTSTSDWRAAVETCAREFGGLDILINNAGIANVKGVEDTSDEEWDAVININQKGVWLGMKYAVPAMRKRGGGSIINISSIYGLIGSDGSTAYHASKGAVRLMTKSAAIQYAPDKIRVNSIHPGLILTPMLGAVTREDLQGLIDATPLKRGAEPEEVGWCAVFLASDEASFVTGSELVVDGGYTAQ
ncbi:MAG TPA: glucose 1-dehydrogenase [Candidatus Binataceae bacterium]|nr:glucose 1-dehydrogenase [Candidatus Binataceae bacterium]